MDLRRPGRVDASLNELEALARKAARGAGLPWGLAEDAGWAVRWLEARELPAATLLAHWLDRRSRSIPVPQRDKGIWTGGNGPLCPLVTGPMLADRAETECIVAAVAAPLLLVPFAAAIALARSRALELAWEGALVRLAVDGEGCQVEGPALAAETTAAVSLHPASAAVQPGRPRPKRPQPPAEVWRRLEALAARTYAPPDPARTGDAGEDDPTSAGRF